MTVCEVCGKQIEVGDRYYFIKGIVDFACSRKCLCGYIEDDILLDEDVEVSFESYWDDYTIGTNVLREKCNNLKASDIDRFDPVKSKEMTDKLINEMYESLNDDQKVIVDFLVSIGLE